MCSVQMYLPIGGCLVVCGQRKETVGQPLRLFGISTNRIMEWPLSVCFPVPTIQEYVGELTIKHTIRNFFCTKNMSN